MEHRTAENRARDTNCDPVLAVSFCRLHDDMTIIEFGPDSGWYTEILGPVLEEHGKLYLASKEEWMSRLDELLLKDFMAAVEKHPIDISYNKETRLFAPGNIVFANNAADPALNTREYHLLGRRGRRSSTRACSPPSSPGLLLHHRPHPPPYGNQQCREPAPHRPGADDPRGPGRWFYIRRLLRHVLQGR